MATKIELEAELERLRAQNDALQPEAREPPQNNVSDDPQAEADAMSSLKQLLDEHGIELPAEPDRTHVSDVVSTLWIQRRADPEHLRRQVDQRQAERLLQV